jgi:hypothetical protein
MTEQSPFDKKSLLKKDPISDPGKYKWPAANRIGKNPEDEKKKARLLREEKQKKENEKEDKESTSTPDATGNK